LSHLEGDKLFSGPIAKLYDESLVPVFFDPYAADMTGRIQGRPHGDILELACGTGAVTRRMAAGLPDARAITATDLNQKMLDQAAVRGADSRVEWRQADAQELPFADGSFDVVVCAFGAMFFPDKAKAYSEARRVLKPGGRLLFNVWGPLAENEFFQSVHTAMTALFPEDPPGFLQRTPYGYHDAARIRADLAKGGFSLPAQIETVPARSRAATASIPAVAICQGTPLRNEIEAGHPGRLADATEAAIRALTDRFGSGSVDGGMLALLIDVER
jgi:SAM-dependent methyltransferase